MDFSFGKVFRRGAPPVLETKRNVVDFDLLGTLRKEIRLANIPGVDVSQLVDEDFVMWERRGIIHEKEFETYDESIRRDRNKMGDSRAKFSEYLKGYKRKFFSDQ